MEITISQKSVTSEEHKLDLYGNSNLIECNLINVPWEG